ncbi:MAG: KaiC 1 [Candidatus Margulisbacteria bacterium GWE2_39_32]|nr:MAG: KaiC 1 [Candidatus Margulisbacteria bacterium GWE2_39_32]
MVIKKKTSVPVTLKKTLTGIKGFDEITFGGVPKGRSTLIVGGPGSGKTVFSMEFLVQGIRHWNEPGLFISFEETFVDLVENFGSMGYDLNKLSKEGKLIIDQIVIKSGDVRESGEYNLDGLFSRMEHYIVTNNVKRVVIDTIEALFSKIPSEVILRSELRRLFLWLKSKGVTALITAEPGQYMMTRHGIEEYVADCLIILDLRIFEQLMTRRLRIMKYRGSAHGTNEYPFIIDNTGFSVLPITSIGLEHKISSDFLSSGIQGMDELLGGKGFYRGSSIVISGMAGSGKSIFAASVCNTAYEQGLKCLYLSSEESHDQVIRNMKSVGLDLEPWVKKDLLKFSASRPNSNGLESHLLTIYDLTESFKPDVVVFDPVTNLTTVGSINEVKSMLTRMMDYLKKNLITTVLTDLTSGGAVPEHTNVKISSLIDSWVVLAVAREKSKRKRELFIMKTRGIASSPNVYDFAITYRGIEIFKNDQMQEEKLVA